MAATAQMQGLAIAACALITASASGATLDTVSPA